MIRVVARGCFQPQNLEQALALYARLAAATRQEPGCIEYVIGQAQEDAGALAVIECWESMAALNAHLESAHFRELVPQIGALRESAEMTIYEQVL